MAQSHVPDLIVLDVRLPRIGGFEVLQKIRGCDPISHVPVVLISANAATESRLQGLKLGADDYITKAVLSARTDPAHSTHPRSLP